MPPLGRRLLPAVFSRPPSSQGASAMLLSSEESQSLSPASRVLAIADKVADEVEKANAGDSEGQHEECRRAYHWATPVLRACVYTWGL